MCCVCGNDLFSNSCTKLKNNVVGTSIPEWYQLGESQHYWVGRNNHNSQPSVEKYNPDMTNKTNLYKEWQSTFGTLLN